MLDSINVFSVEHSVGQWTTSSRRFDTNLGASTMYSPSTQEKYIT